MDSNRKLLEQTYEEKYSVLCAYANSILNDWQLSEDAVQLAFEAAWRKADEVGQLNSPYAWVKKILKNVMLNMLRERKKRNSFLIEFTTELENALPAKNIEENLRDSRPQNIIEDDFEIFLKIIINGYTYEEVAKEHGISIAACRKRVQRTREKLRKYFSET